MPNDRISEGMAIRRAVLGDEYVDSVAASTNELAAPLQELISEYCWGTVWSRPGIPRKTRSMLNIAMLTALNRPDELKLHIHGALRTGCSPDEVVEIILQTAIYCGVPAALGAFRCLTEVLDDN